MFCYLRKKNKKIEQKKRAKKPKKRKSVVSTFLPQDLVEQNH